MCNAIYLTILILVIISDLEDTAKQTLIDKTIDLNTRNFLLCMLYKGCY